MKNTLWFFFPPADEREVLIYKKAYERALSAVVLCIGLMLYSAWFIVAYIGNAWGVDGLVFITNTALGATLLIAYLAGWSVVWREDLALTSPARPRINTARYIGLTAAVIVSVVGVFIFNLLAGSMMIEFPTLIALGVVGVHVVLVVWAWKLSSAIPSAFRLVLCILCAPAMVLIGYWKRKNIGTFIGAYFVASVILGATALAVVIALRLFVYEPVYLTTNAFEPEYQKGDFLLVTKIGNNNITINNLIVYWNENHERTIGLVSGVSWNTIEVGNAQGTRTIPRQQLIGKVIR